MEVYGEKMFKQEDFIMVTYHWMTDEHGGFLNVADFNYVVARGAEETANSPRAEEFHLSQRWKIKLTFYCVTPLGIEFAKACGIIR